MNNRNTMSVLIGCSGWSYDDWIGRFYPLYLAKKKEEWLRYYAQFFKTVEINSTFYRPPSEFLVRSWISKGLLFGEFEFSVKIPRVVTHESLVQGDCEAAINQALSFERICLSPLEEKGLLGAALLQLSPHFKYSDSSLRMLSSLLYSLSCDKFKYAIEFRHNSWLDGIREHVMEDVVDILREHKVAIVVVDGPGFPFIDELTSNHVYIRFHGRNYDIWFSEEREDDPRINRYDYLYSLDQLRPWQERIGRMKNAAAEVRVYFNNHGSAKAVKNALQMMDLLSIPHRQKDVQVQSQMKLGRYGSILVSSDSELKHNLEI